MELPGVCRWHSRQAGYQAGPAQTTGRDLGLSRIRIRATRAPFVFGSPTWVPLIEILPETGVAGMSIRLPTGGQLAWADPVSGLSFAYVTNGLDRHLIRQWRRNVSLNSKAAAVGLRP